MRSGCRRARIPSASRPRRGVEASRYNSSASAASMRPPPRTFAAIPSTAMSVKEQRPAGRHHAAFNRVPVKELEPGALAIAEIVLDIVAQVADANVLMLRRVAKVIARHGVAVRHAGVARGRQRRDIGGSKRTGSPHPEGPYERQAGHGGPGRTKIDL